MKAVLMHVTDQELEDRRTKGLDHWDEMWDGVLHMTPAPNFEHQRMLGRLNEFLGPCLRTSGRGTVVPGINVFEHSENYRIPDLTFIASGREAIIHDDGVRGGGPDAVIEIRSPHDETHEKLPFYASMQVREVIVVDRDSKRCELYRLAGAQFVVIQPDPDGWLTSERMNVRVRCGRETPPRLIVEDLIDPNIRQEI